MPSRKDLENCSSFCFSSSRFPRELAITTTWSFLPASSRAPSARAPKKGWDIIGRRSPMFSALLPFIKRAPGLGLYRSSLAAASTLVSTSGRAPFPLRTLETVATDTPARRATSLSVGILSFDLFLKFNPPEDPFCKAGFIKGIKSGYH